MRKEQGQVVFPRATTIAIGLLGLLVTLLAAPGAVCDVPPPLGPPAPAAPPAIAALPFQAGVCWVGRADREGLAYLAERGVDWISVTPFAYGHRDHRLPPEGGYRFSRYAGESPDGIREVIRTAHTLGLRVLLKPHIWFVNDGKWRGDIAMPDDETWASWFRMYSEFLGPFVEIAREEKVAAFCVGCELQGTIPREKEWRAVIAEVRSRYAGQVTYAANWHREYQDLPFWDALDWIGVQAYFPLTTSSVPTEAELAAGWEPWKRQLAATAKRRGKSIVFTEIGYRPEVDNGREPWQWRIGGEFDPEAQDRAYRALFTALEGETWLRGLHIWKWYSGYTGGDRPRRRGHDGFSPQGLPAEARIFERFRALGPGPSPERTPERDPDKPAAKTPVAPTQPIEKAPPSMRTRTASVAPV